MLADNSMFVCHSSSTFLFISTEELWWVLLEREYSPRFVCQCEYYRTRHFCYIETKHEISQWQTVSYEHIVHLMRKPENIATHPIQLSKFGSIWKCFVNTFETKYISKCNSLCLYDKMPLLWRRYKRAESNPREQTVHKNVQVFSTNTEREQYSGMRYLMWWKYTYNRSKMEQKRCVQDNRKNISFHCFYSYDNVLLNASLVD